MRKNINEVNEEKDNNKYGNKRRYGNSFTTREIDSTMRHTRKELSRKYKRLSMIKDEFKYEVALWEITHHKNIAKFFAIDYFSKESKFQIPLSDLNVLDIMEEEKSKSGSKVTEDAFNKKELNTISEEYITCKGQEDTDFEVQSIIDDIYNTLKDEKRELVFTHMLYISNLLDNLNTLPKNYKKFIKTLETVEEAGGKETSTTAFGKALGFSISGYNEKKREIRRLIEGLFGTQIGDGLFAL